MQGNSRKHIYFCFIDHAKAFDCGSQQTGKFLKRREYQTTLPISWETYKQVRKQQLEPDKRQWICSKFRKKFVKGAYCHPNFTSMPSTSYEMPGWMNHKLESRLLREIPTISDMQMITTLMAEIEEELKNLLMKVERDECLISIWLCF